MSVDLDVDWDIEEDLENTEKHFTAVDVVFSRPAGSIVTGWCGALFRTQRKRFSTLDPTLCPGCIANEP